MIAHILSNGDSMKDRYSGDHFQRVSLVQALKELHKRNISDQHLSDRINEAIRNPANRDQLGNPRISRATIQRYRTTSNELMGAREDHVRTIYNYLAGSREFKSTLHIGYRSIYMDHVTGPLMYSLLHWLSNPNNSIGMMELNAFTGSYELYQPAWSATESDSYERMPAQIELWGTTCHMATSPSDLDHRNIRTGNAVHYAFLIPCGTNVLMLSQQSDPHVFRLYVIHDMMPYPEADQPIRHFSGNVMTVTGKGPHVSRPFFAERITETSEEARVIPRRELPVRVRRKLAAAERTSV